MKNKFITISAVTAVLGVSLSLPAAATMSVRASFADAALSIDAWGSQSASSGFLQTDIPIGSTVLSAYLYSSSVWSSGVAGDVTLNGTFLSSASGSLLSSNNPTSTRIYDVTSFMKSAIESSAGGLQNWSISENGFTDGEVLVVAIKTPVPPAVAPLFWTEDYQQVVTLFILTLLHRMPAAMPSCHWQVVIALVTASTLQWMSQPVLLLRVL